MRLHTVTLGCQMSAADGASMSDELSRSGWEAASLPEADAVVLTTCTVRRHAEQRALSLIGSLRSWKEAAPSRVLIVAGCVAERLGERLSRRFSHVDLVVGARDAARYGEIITEELRRRFPTGNIPRRVQTTTTTAFVTVMRGCSQSCSYCIVPSVRGPEVCRPVEEILAETRRKIAAGAKEVTLLGQRVNGYAGERAGRAVDFADLLRLVDAAPGLERLRFMSPHPRRLDERLCEAVRECRTVCEWMHLPAQSGCDRLLGLMRRGYSRGEFLRRVELLRRAVPGVVLSTDIIVGFPTETDAEFEQSLSLVESLGPAAAFCFKYSPREGTAAADLTDDVPAQAKAERLERLNALVDRLTRKTLVSLVGSRVEVLAETETFGRTRGGLKARWGRPALPGSLVSVDVTGATRRTLLGEFNEP